MPIYEYFCRTCNTRYEKLRPMQDADAPTACPNCKTENSVRTLSVFVAQVGAATPERDPAPARTGAHGGGCCGGACGCH